MKVKWTPASIGHIPFIKASQCFLLSIFLFSECSLFIWLRNVQYIINNVDVYVKTLPRFFIFVEIKGSEKQGKIRKSTCTLKKTKLTFLCIFMHVWVSALSHACRNEVLLHFEGHAKCLLLIIFLNIFYAQNSLQSFESIYFFVSFRNIFNHMEVHHGDKTPGENCSTTPG